MSPMKVRIVLGRQEWLRYEACVQKPLRSSGLELEGWERRSEERVGAEKQLRRQMYSIRNLSRSISHVEVCRSGKGIERNNDGKERTHQRVSLPQG